MGDVKEVRLWFGSAKFCVFSSHKMNKKRDKHTNESERKLKRLHTRGTQTKSAAPAKVYSTLIYLDARAHTTTHTHTNETKKMIGTHFSWPYLWLWISRSGLRCFFSSFLCCCFCFSLGDYVSTAILCRCYCRSAKPHSPIATAGAGVFSLLLHSFQS